MNQEEQDILNFFYPKDDSLKIKYKEGFNDIKEEKKESNNEINDNIVEEEKIKKLFIIYNII